MNEGPARTPLGDQEAHPFSPVCLAAAEPKVNPIDPD